MQSIWRIWKKANSRSNLRPTYTTLAYTLCIFWYLPYASSVSFSSLATLPPFSHLSVCLCLIQWTYRASRLSLLGLAWCVWIISNGHSSQLKLSNTTQLFIKRKFKSYLEQKPVSLILGSKRCLEIFCVVFLCALSEEVFQPFLPFLLQHAALWRRSALRQVWSNIV